MTANEATFEVDGIEIELDGRALRYLLDNLDHEEDPAVELGRCLRDVVDFGRPSRSWPGNDPKDFAAFWDAIETAAVVYRKHQKVD